MKNIQVLIDGKEIIVPNESLAVSYEYDNEDVPKGSKIQFQFTSEGIIADYVNNGDVVPLFLTLALN